MNFAGTFISLARTRFRDNIAVEENGNECTYAALASSVCKVGNALRHLGITQGKVVAGLMHNRTELLETNLARTSKYGIGRIHPKTAAGHGCIALLLLSTVKNGGLPQDLRRGSLT